MSRDFPQHAGATGFGPAYSKAGRNVVYHMQDLDAWLVSRRRLSTSDTGEGG